MMLATAMKEFFESIASDEALAAAVARRLSRSPLLTPEERSFADDVVVPDEIRHAKQQLEIAAYFGRARRRPRLDLSAKSDLEILMTLHAAEKRFLHMYPRLVSFLPGGAAQILTTIEKEEHPHVAWGRRILLRARHEFPETSSLWALYACTTPDVFFWDQAERYRYICQVIG